MKDDVGLSPFAWTTEPSGNVPEHEGRLYVDGVFVWIQFMTDGTVRWRGPLPDEPVEPLA